MTCSRLKQGDQMMPYLSKENRDAYMKAYNAKPETKAKKAAYMRAYNAKPEHKEKISERNRIYYKKNKAAIISRMKENHDSDRVCAISRRYYKKNRSKCLKRIRAYNRGHVDYYLAYHKRQREELTPAYIKKLLSIGSALVAKDIPMELIALKRDEIKLKRLIKEIKND